MYQNKLLWGTTTKRTFPILTETIEADYLIVGGGISGLAAAYFLSHHRQKRIVLVEKHTIGSGSTGHSAGMLAHEPEHAGWDELLITHGSKATKAYYQAHVKATKLVKQIIKEAQIDCDFDEHEYLHLSPDEAPARSTFYQAYRCINQTLDASVDFLDAKALQKEFTTAKYKAAKRTQKHNFSVNPLKFARGFAQYLAQTKHITIFEHTTVKKVRNGVATTETGAIRFKHIIYCRGTHEVRPDLIPYLATIGVTRKLTKKELKVIGLHDKDMFEDEPRGGSFHYGKVTRDNRLLIGYGDKPVSPKKFTYPVYRPHLKVIEQFLKQTFPTLHIPVAYAWSAPYALTTQELPIVELKTDTELYLNGAGLQIGCIAAAAYGVSKLLKKPHPLDTVYLSHDYETA